MLERTKDHIRRNKNLYLVGGACLGTGLAVGLGLRRVSIDGDVTQLVQQIGFRNEANPTIINLIERSTPSKPVHLVGTNLYFSSLSEAARETGHHLSMLSKHVNGHIPDLKGDVFELLEPAA